jgi:hypothetical protein
MKKDSLGVISVVTQWDDRLELQRAYDELSKCNIGDYFIIQINGSEFPDLSVCLNAGIDFCIAQGVEFIHWLHADFAYDDHEWFQSLKGVLNAYPICLKACASNSRDPIGSWRIGHEQSYLLRTSDFLDKPWLFFDERFVRCGGCEDYMLHLNILFRGCIVLVSPECTVYHKGAQTRGKVDTNEAQIYNQTLFGKISGFSQLIEIHDKKYYGCLMSDEELDVITNLIPPQLRKTLGLENWAGSPDRYRLRCKPSRSAYEYAIAPYRYAKKITQQRGEEASTENKTEG